MCATYLAAFIAEWPGQAAAGRRQKRRSRERQNDIAEHAGVHRWKKVGGEGLQGQADQIWRSILCGAAAGRGAAAAGTATAASPFL